MRTERGLQEIAKKAVDVLESHPYMAPPATAAASMRSVTVSRLFLVGTTDPGTYEPGEDTRRLFDIVGLDEGTCGRRPGLR
jgi:hypothetical protein